MPIYVPGRPKENTKIKINSIQNINFSENLPSIPGVPGGPEKRKKQRKLKRSIHQAYFNGSYLDHLFVHQYLVLPVHYKYSK